MVDAEYGLSEGGGGEMQVGGRTFLPLPGSREGRVPFHLKAHGTPGHGSRPHKDNAIVKLGTALERIGNTPFPFQPTETVRGMLEQIFGHMPDGQQIVSALLNPDTFEQALERRPTLAICEN